MPRLSSSNIGSKMMKMMGWTEGEGLGHGGGITAPIEVTRICLNPKFGFVFSPSLNF